MRAESFRNRDDPALEVYDLASVVELWPPGEWAICNEGVCIARGEHGDLPSLLAQITPQLARYVDGPQPRVVVGYSDLPSTITLVNLVGGLSHLRAATFLPILEPMKRKKQEPVNVHEAKTHYSRLLERAHRGEEIILGKAGKPYAKLVPLEAGQERTPGQLRGHIIMTDDFFEPLGEDELKAWEGGGKR